MSQRFLFPLIHPKNLPANQNENTPYSAKSVDKSSASKRNSDFFQPARKRNFHEIDLFETPGWTEERDITKPKLRKETPVIPQSKEENVERTFCSRTKSTAFELLDKFQHQDEKFNDYEGFPCTTHNLRSN